MLNIEQKVHQLINQYRRSINLPTLELDERISQLAREHSQAMANKKVPFGNYGFNERANTIALFLPHKAVSENVAFYNGYPVAEEIVVQFWLKSAKHRNIIQGKYNLTGVGVAHDSDGNYFFTQIFVKTQRSKLQIPSYKQTNFK